MEEQAAKELTIPRMTRYYIDAPVREFQGDRVRARIVYGHDPSEVEEHPGHTGYYLTVMDRDNGNTLLSRGISDDNIRGEELVEIIDEWLPIEFPEEKDDDPLFKQVAQFTLRRGDILKDLPF